MSTGTIQDGPITLSPLFEKNALPMMFTNGEGADVYQGQTVYLSGNLEASLVKDTTEKQFAIGTVKTGAVDGAQLVVNTVFTSNLKAIAKVITFTAGMYVRPNGNRDAEGRPEYVQCKPGEPCLAIVLKGAVADAETVLGLLRVPFTVPGNKVLANTIIATTGDATTDFVGELAVGDIVVQMPPTAGDVHHMVVGTTDTLPEVAVVGDAYFIYRAS